MMRAGFTTGSGNFVEWARISTRDARYAIFYAKRCAVTARCGSQTRPTYGCNTSQQSAYAGANQGSSCKGPAK